MRITHRQLGASSQAAIQQAMSRMVKAQEQLGTQKRFSRMSEDPSAGADVLTLSSRLRDIDQYRRNAEGAISKLNSEEAVVGQVNDILTRAKELVISVSDSGASAAARLSVKSEIDALFQQVVAAGNTKYNGYFLFGGDLVDQAPVTVTGPGLAFTTTGSTANPQVEVSPNAFITTAHNVTEFLGDATTGPLATLRDLSDALALDSDTGVVSALTRLDTDMDRVNVVLGDIGGRQNAADAAKTSLGELAHNAQGLKGALQDTDIAETATMLSRAESAYQAALAAATRLLSLNLASKLG